MELCSYGCGNEGLFKLNNGKYCCNNSYQKCPEIRKKNSLSQKKNFILPRINPATIREKCKFCNKLISITGIKKHELSCFLNEINLKKCPICNNPIKDFKHNVTCSNKCKMIYFSEMYKEYGKTSHQHSHYRTICFENHEKKCIICGEDKIISVHHIDEDRNNNDPKNLIPLCPTHHCYLHSRFKDLIIDKINNYINEFIN